MVARMHTFVIVFALMSEFTVSHLAEEAAAEGEETSLVQNEENGQQGRLMRREKKLQSKIDVAEDGEAGLGVIEAGGEVAGHAENPPNGHMAISKNVSLADNGQKQKQELSTRRIVDGTNGIAPWHAYLTKTSSSSGNTVLFCGGSLIHWSDETGHFDRRWVLTAAHCVDDLDPDERESLRVRFGVYDRWQDDNKPKYKVASIEVHYNWDDAKHSKDLALLKLNRKVNMGGTRDYDISRINLPSRDDPTGETCSVFGFGVETHSKPEEWEWSRHMKTAKMVVESKSFCNQFDNMPGSHFCAVAKETTTGGVTCVGDSGGSFACKKDGEWELAGVTSYGIQKNGLDCDPTQPSFFVSVRRARQWIKDTINPS